MAFVGAVDPLRVRHPESAVEEGRRARGLQFGRLRHEAGSLQLPEAGRAARHEPRAVRDDLLDADVADLLEAVPAGAAAFVEAALGGGVDPPRVPGDVEHRGQRGEARAAGATGAKSAAPVGRHVDAGDRAAVADRDEQLFAGRGERGDPRVGHPLARRPEVGAAIGRQPDTRALGAEQDALRAPGVVGDGEDGERGVAAALPGQAAVLGGVQAGDGAGEQEAVGQGGEARRPALLEAFLEARPSCCRRPGCGRPSRRWWPRSPPAGRRPASG